MGVVIQRVDHARVLVDGKEVGGIGKGLVIFLGVKEGDQEEDLNWLADKCVNLRIFENEEGKFHHSVLDIEGEILIVSQFTLYGNCRKGRRPSFTQAAHPIFAEKMYQRFVETVKNSGLHVETGIFAARMVVEINNKGPVTLFIDSEEK